MSTVNKLIAKALSTTSEEEAMSALRLARKRYKGGNFDLTYEEVADKEKWVKLAKQWYTSAKKFEGYAEYWHFRYMEEKEEKACLALQLDKAKNVANLSRIQYWGSIILGFAGFMVLTHNILL